MSNGIIPICGGIVVAGLILFVVPKEPAQPAACLAIDGDTLNCDGERIRLVAIDAPELPSFNGQTSKAALSAKLLGDIQIIRLSKDRYGRTVANVRVNGESLSCAQIASDSTRYWPRYDPDGSIAKECGL